MKYLRFKKIVTIVVAFSLILAMPIYAFAQESVKQTAENSAKQEAFRVVGYYSGDLFNESVDLIQLDKLTHIMYAFLIPTSSGACRPLEKPEQLKELVEKGHQQGTKIFIAVGGWSYKGDPLVDEFEALASTKESRAVFIESVLQVLREYDLDGVELDWEHPNKSTVKNYELLVVELGAALKKEGKELTAALNGAWSTTAGPEVSLLMTDKILNTFSFINVMAYDMNNEEHSPLWFANTSIEYWLKRGVPAEKIVIGLPLYARPSWKQYRHLVEENPQNAYKDFVEGQPYNSYYNGLNTIREKTNLAIKKAGGVMLFDINEDAQGALSAVSVIHDSVKMAEKMDKAEWEKRVTIIVNQKELDFYEGEFMGQPFVDENGRTLVPIRKSLESIGAKVSYNQGDFSAEITKGETVMRVQCGSNIKVVNGKASTMNTNTLLKEGRIYIPLRDVFETFGMEVKWSNTTKTAYCNAPS